MSIVNAFLGVFIVFLLCIHTSCFFVSSRCHLFLFLVNWCHQTVFACTRHRQRVCSSWISSSLFCVCVVFLFHLPVSVLGVSDIHLLNCCFTCCDYLSHAFVQIENFDQPRGRKRERNNFDWHRLNCAFGVIYTFRFRPRACVLTLPDTHFFGRNSCTFFGHTHRPDQHQLNSAFAEYRDEQRDREMCNIFCLQADENRSTWIETFACVPHVHFLVVRETIRRISGIYSTKFD